MKYVIVELTNHGDDVSIAFTCDDRIQALSVLVRFRKNRRIVFLYSKEPI